MKELHTDDNPENKKPAGDSQNEIQKPEDKDRKKLEVNGEAPEKEKASLSDDEFEHALRQSKTYKLDDRDSRYNMSQKDFDEEEADLWNNDNGLIVDVHRQYDDKIADYEKKAAAGELDKEQLDKLDDMKGAVEKYNETGEEMDPIFPENNGFYGTPHPHKLGEDEIISRYDHEGRDAGSGCFASPIGTEYDDRSLAHDESKKHEHYYRVEPGADVTVQAGEVRDFSKDEGTGATQYQFDKPISEYVKEGKMYECDAEGNRI